MELEISKTSRYAALIAQDGPSARIWFGDNEACKTEADALEAAELLKAFFEAKEAGQVARLVVGEEMPAYCGDEGLACGLGACTCMDGCRHANGPTISKNTAIDQMNARRERKNAFKVAKLAAVIFAHNAHDFDERRAVQSAAKILSHAQEGV